MPGWILKTSDDPPVILRLPVGTRRTLGRTARAEFVVDAALVSRLHCQLIADDSGQLIVEDLGSTNGTLVNDQAVVRAVLKEGDRLGVGRLEFLVEADTRQT